MPIDPYYGDDYIVINTGATFALLADGVYEAGVGATLYAQYSKLAFGLTGTYTAVSATDPLPVTVSAGITATISGFCGPIEIIGVASGQPVPVTGTVTVTGLSASPLYVQTGQSCYVEITGGIPLTRTRDSVSVYGPSGSTWIFANLVDAAGGIFGTTSNPIYANIMGATINATVNATVGVTNDSAGNGLRIQGMSGGTSVAVTVGNTALGLDDTDILTGITACYAELVTLNTNLGSIGISIPTTFKSSRASVTTLATQMDASGFTCQNGINLKASATNTQLVYFGNTSGILASNSYGLDPGEEVFLKVSNTNLVYLVAGSGTQSLFFAAS
jgi:hypothetical protein